MQKQTLIITEKPSAARRLALALDYDGNPEEKSEKGITYYIVKRDVAIIIVPALGHLYTVAIQKSGKYQYPVFDFRWVPKHLVERKSSPIKACIDLISKLSKKAEKFVDACDYDIEGSIIGYTILKYACGDKQRIAYRMKYSTLTKEEIIRAYNEMSANLDFSIIEAGLARHEVDWLYGINLSRALTLIAKNYSGSYATLSTGRVQGPTLNFLEKLEIKRKSFVPTPYWCIKAKVKIGNTIFEADYKKKAIKKKIDVDNIIENCNGTNCLIEKIEKKNHKLKPPFPFYLGSLQREAYKFFKITPERTAKIAQRLYLEALISYPRTSSQKLPSTLDYRAILEKLRRNLIYKKLVSILLKKRLLKPNEGPKKDPAHPAIFPTGNLPERNLNTAEKKIFNLIVKRFLAVFSEHSMVQKTTININIDKNFFLITGSQILEEGWLKFYQPYFKYKNNSLPLITEKQKIKFIKAISEKKFVNPPSRFNPSSLLRKMEKENIGTKATRSGIIKTLEKRKYVFGEKIVVTELGFEIIEILRKYCPTIISIELTHKLEERMEDIKHGKENRDGVINDTIKLLMKTTKILKTKEIEIGAQLSRAVQKARIQERNVGSCPSCGNGKLLMIRSKKTGKRFVGCTNYFEGICKTSYPLPQKGQVKPSIKKCKECGCPTVRVMTKRKRVWNLCLDPQCPSKRKCEKVEV
ncbi:MAG: DNA topoisomerase I [Candidatus Bathyarchaeota archaeon]|nr:DNA topoisomerase I [Candidatus Bathyarchaeota archaeon]